MLEAICKNAASHASASLALALPPSGVYTKVIESDVDKQAYLEVMLSNVMTPNIKMLAEIMLDTGDACTGILLPVSSLAGLEACGQVAEASHGSVCGCEACLRHGCIVLLHAN